jgi:pilus assembly protein Flp/PilA
MKKFGQKIKQFLANEDGPTAVEYAVMLALIIVVCLVSIGSLGTAVNSAFAQITTDISGTKGFNINAN